MTNVHPRLLFAVGAVAGVATLLGVATSSQGEGKPKDERTTRLFHIDAARQRIIGPAPHVQGFLGLRLASVTTDQPQYWPNEKVHLKVLMPGAAGQPLEVSWQKRDANRRTLEGKLDEEGVAVLALHDAAGRLEVGEYRVDVRAPKVNLQASATFSVVEGTLGAVSFAHDFRQVTSFADLSSAKGAWFLGNPGRPGMRWGNALAFRNELRVANQPYHGKVVVVSRCMLPGCNGAHAGPPQDVHVEEGLLSAVLNISGHSGPFQIEVVSPRGTVRHQFSGSSHVERDFVQVARGVSWLHRAGLAPYKDTVQVPGRQVFVESRRQGEDAFELASVIADGGEVVVKANREVRGFTAHVHAPRAGAAAFELAQPKVPATLSAGATVRIPVSGPMSLVALGGFISGAHVEGYAVVFPPAALKVAVEAPARSAPMREVPVSIQVTDALGRPVAASGVLEVFDNRVASRNPADPLGSALGDSVRNASSALSRWVDPIELEKRRRARAEEMKAADTSRSYPMVFQPAQAKPSAPPPGYARGAGIFRSKVKLSKAVPSVGPRGGPPGVPAAEDGAPSDPIREGEKKVVACERVRLGAGGRATVRVQLPPQTGRVTFRFVAVRGLEHATGRADADVAKDAYVDARLPRTFVPGAKIRLDVTAVNERKQALRLQVSGPGIQGERDIPIAAGTRKSVVVPWEAAEGTVELRLVDARGQTVDHRQMNARAALEQPVTWSRLAFGGGDAIALAPGETVVVYPNPGALLHDAVANIVTTMHSWFGHAEALSAQAAVRGAVLAAIHRGLLSDNGLEQSLRVDLDKAVRDLEEKFFDAPSGLVRPFPGMAPKPLWSAWVARNLHSAVRSLRASPRAGDVLLREATARAQKMASAIDRALAGTKPEELSGYDPSQGGAETIRRRRAPSSLSHAPTTSCASCGPSSGSARCSTWPSRPRRSGWRASDRGASSSGSSRRWRGASSSPRSPAFCRDRRCWAACTRRPWRWYGSSSSSR
jgi:hypothetical protein